MTLPRLQKLRDHWLKHPRVEWLVAGYLKYKPPENRRGLKLPLAQKDTKGAAPADLAAYFGLKPGQSYSE